MRGPRTRQITAINSETDRALEAGVRIDGIDYHSDSTFLIELLALIMGYQRGLRSGTQPIRTVDNRVMHLDEVQIVALASALSNRRQAIYADAWAEKDALDAGGDTK